MSEILIYYDYNGGFVVRDHYVDKPATGRSLERALENWFRRNQHYVIRHDTGKVNLRHLSFCVMEGLEWSCTTEQVRDRMPEWVTMVQRIQDENKWIESRTCECCGQWIDEETKP